MPRKEIKTLKKEEVIPFLENAKRFGFYEFYLLELQTGLKFGEIIAITWDDFDPLTGTIQISKIYQRVKGIGKLASYKGTPNKRTVKISKECVDLLCNRRDRLPRGTELIFPSTDTWSYWYPETIRKNLNFICTHAGIPVRYFNDIEKTYTALALNQKRNRKVLKGDSNGKDY